MTDDSPTVRLLDGVHVVSLAGNLPGPLAVERLVEWGARATKVESPQGDMFATAAPQWYAELRRGQEVVVLDLKQPGGQQRFAELLREADVLVTSMRPSAAERLGLPALAAQCGVGFVEIVGHADDPDRPGHDLTYQASAGTLHPSVMPLVPVADMLGAERAVSAVLAALRLRDAGRPARLRVSLEEAAQFASGAVRHGLTTPGGLLGGGLPQYAVYATADGHVALAALEPHFAQRLAAHVGTTADEITQALAARTTAEWEERAAELDIPLVAVRSGAASS